MALSTPPSPISTLPADILWVIFEINSRSIASESDQALTHSIRASQVCHSWRKVILSSTSLWARLINFSNPVVQKEAGRTEILRRSDGSAPLWIMGRLRTEESYRGFFSVLDTHWERIEILDVDLWEGYSQNHYQLWRPLFRPAPALRVIKLPVANYQPPSRYAPPLFGNHAPQLTVYHLTGIIEGVSLRPKGSWIPQVRHIRLSKPLGLSDVLDTLQRATLLESLIIDTITVKYPQSLNTIVIPPSIILPHLKDLRISDCSDEIWFPILKSLAPFPLNSFHFKAANSSLTDDLNQTTSEIACENILKFIQVLRERNRTTHVLRIIFNSLHGVTHFRISLEDSSNLEPVYFSVNLNGFPRLSGLLMANLATHSLLSSVQHMHLYLDNDVPDLRASFAHLLSALTSLASLRSTDNILEFLLEYCDSRCLPKLHTLILPVLRPRRSWPVGWEGRYSDGLVMAFLRHRNKVGLPLSVLDLSEATLRMDMNQLEEIPGLTVR